MRNGYYNLKGHGIVYSFEYDKGGCGMDECYNCGKQMKRIVNFVEDRFFQYLYCNKCMKELAIKE